ncbi:LLM class F420-dependent oxidoreductase [Nonomuraea sp. NPDC002799]
MNARMRLGAAVGGVVGKAAAHTLVTRAKLAESLGYDSLWAGEAYGGDAVTALAWAAAHTERIRIGSSILQIPGRTPAMTAMTAASLAQLSGGRFVLGLGVSGPQVVEGWHGRPFTDPIGLAEEYITLVRRFLTAGEPVGFAGKHFRLPYDGEGASGLGKAIKPGFGRVDVPIHLAAIGPRNVEMAVRVADGLLPYLWNPHRSRDVYGKALDAVRPEFEIMPMVFVAMGDDVAACRDKIRPTLAFYVGGMGARGRNFYNRLVRRYGYEAEAEKIQDLFLAGRREEAVAAVPDTLVDELALVGPREKIAEQLEVWKASGVTGLILGASGEKILRTVAELVL